MSGKPPFDEVWKRISVWAGDVFFTKTGLRFTYKVEDDKVLISRGKYTVSRNDLRRAYEMVPLGGPSQLSSVVRGPTYVWAILHDARASFCDTRERQE